MTKLEYDSKIYNSTAPFHISFGKYSKHMVRFSDQKISISTQNFISTHVWKPTNSWTNVQFLFVCTWCNHGGLQAKIQEQLGYLFLNFFN